MQFNGFFFLCAILLSLFDDEHTQIVFLFLYLAPNWTDFFLLTRSADFHYGF